MGVRALQAFPKLSAVPAILCCPSDAIPTLRSVYLCWEMWISVMHKYPFRLSIIWIALIAVFISAFRAAPAFQVIRVESALVAVPVIVSNSQGRYIPGLKAESFSLFQDGMPEKISLFLATDDSFKIALLLDTSSSTTTVLRKIKQAAKRFLQQMRPNDLAMVVSFDSDIRILSSFSSDRWELEKAIDKAEAAGSGTKLRDAILNIQNRFRSISGRKAIVLLTDGDDHGSVATAVELRDSVLSSGTLIYSVFYNIELRELIRELFGVPLKKKQDTYPDWAARMQNAALYLQEISELSAGRFYKSKVTELDRAFRQISEELHSQYLIGFYPDQSKLDGSLHSLVVKVNLKDSIVRHRSNYRKISE
jgi:Ca-activated chloride channel homolog